MRSENGTLVVADDKETYVELTPSQMQSIGGAPVAYQDSFPLIPGTYDVNVILRNRVLQQFTVAERTIAVASYAAAAAPAPPGGRGRVRCR